MNDEKKQKIKALKESIAGELNRTKRRIQGVIVDEEEDLKKILEHLEDEGEDIEKFKQELNEICDTE